MAITYTWKIDSMPNYPKADGESNVIFQINFTLIGTDGTYTASESGSLAVNYVAGEPYTPYAELTESQVLGWVTTGIYPETLALMKANIADLIEKQANPPYVILPLPWGN